MNIHHHGRLQEMVISEVLDCGLEVHVIPKKGFSEKYAVLTTRFGSVDHSFIHPETGQMQTVPDGIAHFLEHTLFEKEDGNISDRFSDRGAYHNAYTSFVSTSYLFSCARDFPENLNTLMDLAYHPYFTEVSVEQEKGIIAQEIIMYDDLPHWRVYQNLLEAMYHTHPVRINIAGNVPSIRSITPETLADCHRIFYHPQNMALYAAGDLDVEQVIRAAAGYMERIQLPPFDDVKRQIPEEPAAVARNRVEEKGAVLRPLMMMGWKEADPADNPRTALMRELENEIIMEALFGKGSDLFNELYESGVLSGPLDLDFSSAPHYGHALIGTETEKPDDLIAEIEKTLRRVRKDGLDPRLFEESRRRIAGSFIQTFDHMERLVNAFVSTYHRGFLFFDYDTALREVCLSGVRDRLCEFWVPEGYSVSLIRP
jgi:predicted Zn-dependent peptidase